MDRNIYTRFFSLVFFFSALTCVGQKTDHHWAFGYKGMVKFENGAPKLVGKSVLVCSEGSATVSDNDGNLLFYTDGDNVYGKDNQLLANGDDLGSPYTNATQSSLIIKKPGSDHLYYIFTTAAVEVIDKHFYYNIVDMNAQGGKGEVIEKKQILISNYSTERIAAVSHTNGVDMWVLTQKRDNNGELAAFLLTKNGVTDSVFTAAQNVPGYLGFRGGMTIAKNGEDVAVCYEFDTLAHYYKFDRESGVFTFQQNLFVPADKYRPYNCAFTADASKLYIGARYTLGLYQFDMTATNIAASKVKIKPTDTIADVRFCAPLLGPDDKIYVAGFNGSFDTSYYGAGNWLGVIDQPNEKGNSCNFSMRGFFVDKANGAASMSYSPVYIPAIQNFDMAIDSPACSQKLTQLAINNLNPSNNYSFEWEINGTPLNKDSAIIHHLFGQSGKNIIQCKVCDTYSGFCSTIDTFVIIQEKPTLSVADQIICDQSETLVLLKRDTQTLYTWYNSSLPLADSNWVKKGTHIWKAENFCGMVLDTFEVSVKTLVDIEFYNTTLCGSGSITVDLLDYKTQGVTFYWPQFNDSSYYKRLTDAATTTYQIISTQCDSSVTHTMTVTRSPEKIWIPNAFTPNGLGVEANESFKPFGVYYSADYHLEVYSRWGEKLFETHDPNEAWDGTYQGQALPPGRYMYIITARNCKNDRTGYKGQVHLIR